MRLRNQQTQRVQMKLQEALDGVQAELSKAQSGLSTLDSEANLRWIAAGLETMLRALVKSEKPEPPGIWRVVTDTWPFADPLRKIVIEAEYDYQRLAL